MRNDMKDMVRKLIDYIRTFLSGKNPNLPYYLLIFFAFIAFIFGVNLFIELTDELPGSGLKVYDDKITDYIISFRTPELNHFFQFVTDLGDVYAYIVVTTIAVLFFFFKLKNKKFIFQLLGVLLLSALSNIALKQAINRARPTIEHMVVVKTLSYPSGHSMSAMAFYGFLIYLLFRIKMAKWLRFLLAFIFTFLILSIGLSRIYLGVHFPSDVAGGFIAGLIWVAFCIVLFNIIDLLRERKRARTGEGEEENLEP
ncbi:phosphatase PAP2 family protein [Salinimicrobium soli]|uniref:phosphatase PAP2 family protein n=1 Tax=Salinimicrobium soli TaxID=1254399 RepID=UPI003AAC9C47